MGKNGEGGAGEPNLNNTLLLIQAANTSQHRKFLANFITMG